MTEQRLAQQYREGLMSFGERMPDVLSAYNQFTSTCFQTGEIRSKDKHLMAMAIALCSGNEHCMVYHLELAMQEGATEQEVAEAAAVAGAYGGGSAFSHGAILLHEAMQSIRQSVH